MADTVDEIQYEIGRILDITAEIFNISGLEENESALTYITQNVDQIHELAERGLLLLANDAALFYRALSVADRLRELSKSSLQRRKGP